ncbi:MAG: SU10 major capsid protein, partial [Candidatus Thorarchaeota archaeon]
MPAKNLSASGVLFTDRRDFYLRPNVTKELWTDVAPFTTVVSNNAMVKVTDPDYKMFEHRSGWVKQEFQLNDASPNAWSDAGAGAPGATQTVDAIDGVVGLPSLDTSYIGLECEIWSDDGAGAIDSEGYLGVCLITAQSGNAITIKSLGDPTHATFEIGANADNDHFVVIGSAKGEGQTAREAYSDELEVVYNSAQIFDTPVEVTGTLYETALRGYSNELARLRLEKNKEHKIQKERTFLMGMRTSGIGGTAKGAGGGTDSTFVNHTTDGDGKVVRSTMGVITALRRYGQATTTADDQNVFTINEGSYQYANFVDDTEKVFQYVPTSGVKTAFVGAKMLSYWSKLSNTQGFVAQSGWNVQISDFRRDRLGFNYRILETPHGLVRLIPTPVLRGHYASYMIIVDTENLQHTIFRAPKFKVNIKTDDGY